MSKLQALVDEVYFVYTRKWKASMLSFHRDNNSIKISTAMARTGERWEGLPWPKGRIGRMATVH